MVLDAIVPAGGRATRLGGIAKPLLTLGGVSLLQRSLDAAAAAGARRTVAVGPDDLPVPAGVMLTREDPPFGGPLAAVAAGLAALDTAARRNGSVPADWLLVLAADQPGVAGLTPVLLAALPGLEAGADSAVDAVIGTDPTGRRQYLAACYRGAWFREALARQESGPSGGSMKRLVGEIGVTGVAVPGDAVGDVDTPDDAVRWGLRD